MADGRWQKKEKTSGKKGVIKADLVSEHETSTSKLDRWRSALVSQ